MILFYMILMILMILMIYRIDEITDTGCIDLFLVLILFIDNDVMFFVRGEDLWSGTINFVVEE